MNAEAIRRALADSDIESLRVLTSDGADIKPLLSKMVGHISHGYGSDWRRVVDMAPRIAETMEDLLRAVSFRYSSEEDFLTLFEAFVGDTHDSARAITSLEATKWSSNPWVAGSLAGTGAGSIDSRLFEDGSVVSRVLAISLAEYLDRESNQDYDELLRLESFMVDDESVVREWRCALHRCLPRMAMNAGLCGYDLATSHAKACAEGVMRTGRAMQGTMSSQIVFALASSALETLSYVKADPPPLPYIVRFGAVALATAHGFSAGWMETSVRVHAESVLERACPLQDFDRYDSSHKFTFIAHGLIPLHFTWNELAPLVSLTVRAACNRLESDALSPKLSEHTSKRYLLFASAVEDMSTALPEDTSFARVLGIRETFLTEDELRDGSRLFRAVPIGPRPSVCTIKGRGRREMRLYAMANEDGKLVGYAGVDPLSEEFYGMPERYVYDLEGWRQGRLVDGIFRKGRPRVKMLTAPEGVELPCVRTHFCAPNF